MASIFCCAQGNQTTSQMEPVVQPAWDNHFAAFGAQDPIALSLTTRMHSYPLLRCRIADPSLYRSVCRP